MRLARLRLVRIGPFVDTTIAFEDGAGAARRVVVVFGAGGVGKTALLSAVATTRPGHALPPLPPAGLPRPAGAPASFAAAEWTLGDDDPSRPHPLRVVSPNVTGETEEDAAARRREQTHFDRRAADGGFCLVAFSGARWFSRTPAVLSAPHRTFARYDVRAPAVFDDPTRADLARETKQALAYPTIAAALSRAALGVGPADGASRDLALDAALHGALAPLLSLAGASFTGVDPTTLEPTFERAGRAVAFDDLPRGARHLTALAALTLRALHGAYPDRDPRTAEGIALVDDVELCQDGAVARALVPALRASFPNVQWIVTTSSPTVALACDACDVLMLRSGADGVVEVHDGAGAILH